MSLLSPDTLALYISPERIQAVKAVGLGQRPVEVHQRNASVQPTDNWQDMMRVSGELIRQTRASRIHVVLSDKLARYACFPWREELRNQTEDHAMAVLNFDDVYGVNASADWHFGFSAGAPGQSRLSIAVPKSLYEVLRTHMGQNQAKVTSVQTAFSATLRTHRKQLGNTGWLVNLENGRLTLGCWTNDAWNWVYSVHAEFDGPEALLARIQHEIKMASTSLKTTQLLQICIHAPAFEHLPFGALEGVRFVSLKTQGKEPGPKYAFALMGIKA